LGSGINGDESLDEFLDNLGKQPNMQANWDKETRELLDDPEIHELTQLPPAYVVQQTVEAVKDNFAVERFPAPVGQVRVTGTLDTNKKQKSNIVIICYSLFTQGIIVTPDEVYDAWPTEGDVYTLERAGKRPSLTAIQQYFETEEFKNEAPKWGFTLAVDNNGLTDEQTALIEILSNTAMTGGLQMRLKKAGVSASKFRAWKRQRPFAEAYKKLVQFEREDAAEHVDIQLISMAQNGNLKAIQYYNELVGRGPNDKKAVDAMQFSKIVLESVMKHVNADQLKAISAEIELASKQLGM
jgi:hypothetical protein